jgi:endonuclease G
MRSLEERISRLRQYNASLRSEAEPIGDDEIAELALPPERALEQESIILRRRRPVLAVRNGTATLEFTDPADGSLWKQPLQNARTLLDPAIAAVGRIDLKNNPDYTWVGTGWLVHKNVLVTNRHVAEVFSAYSDDGFVFQTGMDGDMEAAVDFLEEIDRAQQRLFQVRKILYIEPPSGPDLAFLEVDRSGGELATPILLSQREPSDCPSVVTIGYPAYDSRIPEPDLMEKIYGKVYDKKRLAPGSITDFDDQHISHNCTTLGGNSGSAVVDLKTGEAVGLHFSGTFMRTNFAVRAGIVRERLDALLGGTLGLRRERTWAFSHSRAQVSAPSSGASSSLLNSGSRGPLALSSDTGSTSITIPLSITISLGSATTQPRVIMPRPSIRTMSDEGDDASIEGEAKAKPEDYADRSGYSDDFLEQGSNSFGVELPLVVRNAKDVLTLDDGEQELRYEHFSVVMNKRRRMCFFSACNIDGARSKTSRRTTWRFDPRIPTEFQIMKECYGNAPKFSRGHMTRREDPAWGTPASIQRGSDDSMHVTNVTPQLQAFNSPIWLGLEDYALEHARRDKMRISVFTGPFFSTGDPTMFGVRIPVRFWKVIAFIHDDTGKLCATGYEMSQEDNLAAPEFVFGDFRSPQLNMSTQVAIASIESRTGITFGSLADVDPLGEEGPEVRSGPLTRFEQVRFT